jgi:hypothetical protein
MLRRGVCLKQLIKAWAGRCGVWYCISHQPDGRIDVVSGTALVISRTAAMTKGREIRAHDDAGSEIFRGLHVMMHGSQSWSEKLHQLALFDRAM